MTGSHSKLPKLPLQLSPLQILGFVDPVGGDWSRLRALQYAGPRHIPLIRGGSQLLAAVVTFSLFSDSVSMPLLIAWFVAMATAVWNWSLINRSLVDVDRRSMTRAEFRRHAISSAACGLVWAVALLLFVNTGARADDHVLWSIVVMLIAGSAATTSSAPLATVMFAGVSGIMATLHFTLKGEYGFALLVAGFICVVIHGRIDAARTFLSALHADAEERRKLELSLRHAVGKNEFELNFQPVVTARDETLVSFEALVRWNSEEHGMVSPGKFIPLAEDTRLIVPIGEWVLHEACRQAARWPSDVKVAVNVSGEQLLEPGFSRNVVRALADSGLPAHRLEVEVTESIFLRDGRTARQTLEEIMALGCAIAVDDFGTGYSLLGYLRTLRFSTIKVDQSFVQGASQGSNESLAIIRAVVAMAQSLDMSTTAEGVETAQQLEIVREIGCDKIQGYYYGRQMSPIEALALIERKAREAA